MRFLGAGVLPGHCPPYGFRNFAAPGSGPTRRKPPGVDARPIEDRPQAAEGRSGFGHPEGDLVIGSDNSHPTVRDGSHRNLRWCR